MPPTDVLSSAECQAILQRWKDTGVSDEERSAFMTVSNSLFANNQQGEAVIQDIKNMAESAASIDQTFIEVQKILGLMVIFIWPIGLPLFVEWGGYIVRWRSALKTSIGVANSTIDILKRFDEVYLAKVESIQTEKDRLDAMALLEPFIKELENDDQSAQMSREFLELKRDVEAFVNRFNLSGHSTGIDPMLKEIELLDEQIRAAQKTLIASGVSTFAALRAGAKVSPVIASLQAQRQQKVDGVSNLHRAMVAMNSLVIPSPAPKQAPNEQITAPDIGSLLQELMAFAEVWASVRSQTVQFREHLNGGLEAATNGRFKAEVRLARDVSRDVGAALNKYVTEVGSWVDNL